MLCSQTSIAINQTSNRDENQPRYVIPRTTKPALLKVSQPRQCTKRLNYLTTFYVNLPMAIYAAEHVMIKIPKTIIKRIWRPWNDVKHQTPSNESLRYACKRKKDHQIKVEKAHQLHLHPPPPTSTPPAPRYCGAAQSTISLKTE